MKTPAQYLGSATIVAFALAASLGVARADYVSTVLSNNPVVFWQFADANVTTESSDTAANFGSLPVATNSGTLGAVGNGGYLYSSATALGPVSPGFPGFSTNNMALTLDGSSGGLEFPALDLTNNVTMECWVYLNGQQSPYSGLIYGRDNTNVDGIFISSDGQALGATWGNYVAPDGSPWGIYGSGMEIPLYQWTYVAMEVSSNEEVLCLGTATEWITQTNFYANYPQSFTANAYIGSDDDRSFRTINGEIADVAIYNQALSSDQLYAHAQAALTGQAGAVPPSFVNSTPAFNLSGIVLESTPFTLIIGASGSPPLSYQWRLNGAPIAGSTSAIYTNASSLVADSGSYDVVVTNAYGAVTSSVTSVSISKVTTFPPSTGTSYENIVLGDNPVGYWRFSESNVVTTGVDTLANLADAPVATNSGGAGPIANGGYLFSSATELDLDGPTYEGFENNNSVLALDGTNGSVVFPRLNLLTANLTVECWLYLDGVQSPYSGIVFSRGPAITGLNLGSDGQALGASSVGWGIYSSGLEIPLNEWTYVALTLTPSEEVLFLATSDEYTAVTNYYANYPENFVAPGYIGVDPTTSARTINGLIDEVAIYRRTLNPAELLTHAQAGFGGLSNAPSLMIQPYVTPAGPVASTTPFTLSVLAFGTPPLSYQWQLNGNPISGATNSTYGKLSASAGDDGNYNVVVTNAYGQVTSLAAAVQVTVNPVLLIGGINISGTTLNITASGGPLNTPCVLLQSSDLTLPVSQWTPALTNLFDNNGNVTLSGNIINSTNSQMFYTIQAQ